MASQELYINYTDIAWPITMEQIVRLLSTPELERHLTRTDSAQEIALAIIDAFAPMTLASDVGISTTGKSRRVQHRRRPCNRTPRFIM